MQLVFLKLTYSCTYTMDIYLPHVWITFESCTPCLRFQSTWNTTFKRTSNISLFYESLYVLMAKSCFYSFISHCFIIQMKEIFRTFSISKFQEWFKIKQFKMMRTISKYPIFSCFHVLTAWYIYFGDLVPVNKLGYGHFSELFPERCWFRYVRL